MRHPLEYFDRIFIINLASRTDRKAGMALQLKAIGLNLTDTSIELCTAVRPDAPEQFPSIGARGCFLSHLGILRRAKELGLQRVAIFEDDLNFSINFEPRMASMLEQLESINWSMFYGGYHIERAPSSSIRGGLIEAQPDEPIGATHFVAFQGEAISTVVRYLEQILARPAGHPKGGPMHIDGAYNWFRRTHPQFKTVLAVPALGFQRNSRTDIHELRWYDTVPFARQTVAGLRLAKNALKRR